MKKLKCSNPILFILAGLIHINVLVSQCNPPLPPQNDLCINAINLGSSGTLSNQTNLCATSDILINACPVANSNNSVWYTFNVDPGNYGVNILVNGLSTNGNPIEGPLSGGIFSNDCGTNYLEEDFCFSVATSVTAACLNPGSYYLQLSGPSATAGDFSITISQLEDDRVCPVGALSDVCYDAIVIDMNGIYCTEIPVSSCNFDACAEDFIVPGCTFQTNPTVWFTFTVDANASSIDITQMTAGFSYCILSGSPCTSALPTTITGCLSASNTPNIPIIGGATYYLIVTSPNDGPFSFNIIQNVAPENDDPDPNSIRPPYVLGIGDGHDSSTCCALGFNDGPGADLSNVSCSGATNDGAVWYRYTTGSEIGFRVTLTPTGSNPISGPTTVEILSGSTNGPNGALFTPTSVWCGPAPVILKVGCFNPGEEVWIKVASASGDCGSFNITINEINQCPLAETCPDAADVIITNPTDPDCGSFVPVTVQGCLEAACSESMLSVCGADSLPTVWFKVLIDNEAVQLGTSIQSNGTWDPVWAIYYGSCDSLSAANAGTLAMPVLCSNGDSNPDIHTVGTITGETTYWIAVSGEGLIDDPTFTLNVWTSALCVACIGEDGCEPDAEWIINSRSSDRPLDDPYFCQGEEVTVCVNYLYDASETGVDWLHGLIPDFGPGWDMEAFDPSTVTVSPGNPGWYDEDDGPCAPYINEKMPYLCTYKDPVTGNLKICHRGCQICPCTGSLKAGAPLPSGWFWNTNGGAGCANDCSPSTHYGIGQVVVNISFCLDLKVRVFDTEAECNMNRSLHFNFLPTSDGVSGCWEDPIAECKLDFAQIGPKWEIDCNRPPRVLGDDVELCTEGLFDIDLTNEDGDGNVTIEVKVIDNPNVTGENNYTFTGGSGTITDYLVNTSRNIEQVFYLATSRLPGFICPSPQDTFIATLYPEVVVDFENYTTCSKIVPIVTGGSGRYTGTIIPFAYGYIWANGYTTECISVKPNLSTFYGLTVTDDKGCSGTGDYSFTIPSNGELCCDQNPSIICGQKIQGNTSIGNSDASAYNCVTSFLSGPELIYEFENIQIQSVLITLSDLSQDLELIITKNCDRNDCFQHSNRSGVNEESIYLKNLPLGTYQIIVDGYNGASSPFSLTVECDTTQYSDTLNCNLVLGLNCELNIDSTNINGSDLVNSYSCNASNESGKENIYRFASDKDQYLHIQLSKLDTNLDLFMLSDCDVQNCISSSTKSGKEIEHLTRYLPVGSIAYIVVDGFNGAQGSYNISAECLDPCADPEDCPTEIGGPGNQQIINAETIFCGIPKTGNTNTGQANASYYSCADGYNIGKEIIYVFDNVKEQDVSIITSKLTANVDVYVLNGPSITNCIASSQKLDTTAEAMILQLLPVGRYYIVIDGYDDVTSNFEMVINCLDKRVNVVNTVKDNTIWNVFPNPSNGLLNVEIQSLDEKIISLDIISLHGQHVLSHPDIQVSDRKVIHQIDANHVMSGTYIVRLKSKDKVMYKKIVLLR